MTAKKKKKNQIFEKGQGDCFLIFIASGAMM